MIFCFGVAVVSTTKAMLAPLVPLYAVHLGASPATVGLLISAAFWLPLVLALMVGARIDQAGSRTWLLGGSAILVIAPILIAAVSGFAILAVAQVLIGLAQLAIVLSSQTFVATLADGRERMTYYGWYSSFQSAGQLIGPIAVGLVIDAEGFRAAFLAAGVIPLLAILLLLLALANEGGAADRNASGIALPLRHYPKESVSLIRRVGVQVSILMSFSVIFAMTFQATFLPVYMDDLGFTATAIGALFSARALGSMVVRPWITRVIDLHGNRSRTMVSMTAMMAVGIAAIGFSGDFPMLALFVLVTGVAAGISQPLSLVAVADHAPSIRRGFAIGLRLTGNRLAQVASPILLGLLVEAAGFRFTFVTAGVVLALTAVAIMSRMDAFERSERLTTQPDSLS